MTLNAMPDDRQLALAPLDEKVDHVRGSPAGPLILEYGDYECPYSRQAFHAIEHAGQQLGGNVRFAFRHFPLTGIHPHALAAAAEAAARQGWFWDMHELLFHRQKALEDADLRGYAAQLGPDVAAFDRDRSGAACWSGSSATSTAAWPRARSSARRRCSSTAWCTAAATTRPPCWPRWAHERALLAYGQHQADRRAVPVRAARGFRSDVGVAGRVADGVIAGPEPERDDLVAVGLPDDQVAVDRDAGKPKPGKPSSASTRPHRSHRDSRPDRYSHPKPRLGHSRPDGPRSRRTIMTDAPHSSPLSHPPWRPSRTSYGHHSRRQAKTPRGRSRLPYEARGRERPHGPAHVHRPADRHHHRERHRPRGSRRQRPRTDPGSMT
jgi:hypothetical protein